MPPYSPKDWEQYKEFHSPLLLNQQVAESCSSYYKARKRKGIDWEKE
jgi:hypothetical protein